MPPDPHRKRLIAQLTEGAYFREVMAAPAVARLALEDWLRRVVGIRTLNSASRLSDLALRLVAGEIELRWGGHHEAEEHFCRAGRSPDIDFAVAATRSHAPLDAHVYLGMGRVRLREGRPDDAILLLHPAVELFGAHRDARFSAISLRALGLAYLLVEQFAEAEQCLADVMRYRFRTPHRYENVFLAQAEQAGLRSVPHIRLQLQSTAVDPDVAAIYEFRGRLAAYREEWAKAHVLLTTSGLLFEALGMHHAAFGVRSHLAQVDKELTGSVAAGDGADVVAAEHFALRRMAEPFEVVEARDGVGLSYA